MRVPTILIITAALLVANAVSTHAMTTLRITPQCDIVIKSAADSREIKLVPLETLSSQLSQRLRELENFATELKMEISLPNKQRKEKDPRLLSFILPDETNPVRAKLRALLTQSSDAIALARTDLQILDQLSTHANISEQGVRDWIMTEIAFHLQNHLRIPKEPNGDPFLSAREITLSKNILKSLRTISVLTENSTPFDDSSDALISLILRESRQRLQEKY